MKKLVYLIVLAFSTTLVAQDVKFKDFNSIELGTTRTLKIYVPPSYAKDTTRLYPLTILFDGDFLFDVYVGNAKLFAQRDKAPEQIIVGIIQNKHKERYSDCSYDKVSGLPTEDSERFYRFVRAELLDYMESHYRLSPFRTLVGTTLTANFVNFFVIEDEPAFDAFININPYYSPDMPTFLENVLSQERRSKMYYYLNSGPYNSDAKHKRIEQVAHLITDINNPNVLFKYDTYKSTKTASIGQAIPAALAFIFDIYSAISKEEFALNVQHLSPPDAIDYVKNKYVEIDYLFGTNMKIRERDIYAIESIVIDQENGDYLAEFGEMINQLYPESPLSDYYIGMFYEKAGKYKQALKNYKNGYAKMDENGADAEAYYQNIERVLNRQDEIIEQEELEKAEKKENKEAYKEQREAAKEAEKEAKKAKKEEWEKNKEQRKEQEKEMREKYRKKKDD
jgi:hypothetical protein